MPYFVGLDVAKDTTSICVVDANGVIVEETVSETTPHAITQALRGAHRQYRRVGMEASNLAGWLHAGLSKAGFPIISIDPRHAHAVLSTRYNKTDRNDARGIAELMRIGSYKTSHIRSSESQQVRAVLVARDALVAKRRALDGVVRAILLSLGAKLPKGIARTFAARVEALLLRYPDAVPSVRPLLRVRETITTECVAFDRLIEASAAGDPVCRRLMTAPGVGPLAALAFRCAVDDPHRFPRSRSVGALFGLVPRTHQSGERSRRCGITRAGDPMTRKFLYLAAFSLSRARRRESWLSQWAASLRERMSFKQVMVAVARKLAVVLHRMWVDGVDFQWQRPT